MLPVDYLSGARHDFDESFDWYSGRSTQAAVRFANAVDAALIRIATNPTRFASPDGVHRAFPVKKFPFRIVYCQRDTEHPVGVETRWGVWE